MAAIDFEALELFTPVVEVGILRDLGCLIELFFMRDNLRFEALFDYL